MKHRMVIPVVKAVNVGSPAKNHMPQIVAQDIIDQIGFNPFVAPLTVRSGATYSCHPSVNPSTTVKWDGTVAFFLPIGVPFAGEEIETLFNFLIPNMSLLVDSLESWVGAAT